MAAHRNYTKYLPDLAYVCCYIVFYAGWWFHRSGDPIIFNYTLPYLLALLVLGAFIFIPICIRLYVARLGRKRAIFASVVMLMVLFSLYYASSTAFYHTREYRFDPFLQVPAYSLDDIPLKNEKQTTRIMMLGGSTTRCASLPRSKRYPQQVHDELRRIYPDHKLEILNCGMDWFTTRHSLINYISYCRDWQPEVVVVMHGINDLYSSFSSPRHALGPYNGQYRHFYGSAIRAAKSPTFEEVFFWQNMEARWYSSLRFKEVDLPLKRYVSLAAFERNLHTLIDCLTADGAQVVLVSQPCLIKPNPSESERRRLMFARDLCVERFSFWRQVLPSPRSLHRAMQAYQAKVRSVAQERQVCFADAASQVPGTLEYFTDDVHYTPQGARRLAEVVAQTIVEHELLEERTKSAN